MKRILFLLLIVCSTMYGQKSPFKIEGNEFMVINKDTGTEVARINNYKPIKGFLLGKAEIHLLSESCKGTECNSEINSYTIGKEGFEYSETIFIKSKIEFGACINGMKNVLEFGMAVDKKGDPIHVFSGNQPSTEKEINCMYMTYFSARGDEVGTKLAGYFDTKKDGLTTAQYKLLKRFFTDMKEFGLNTFEFVDTNFKSIQKINDFNEKGSYLVHYTGTIENVQVILTKITNITKKKLKKRARKRKKGTGVIDLVIDCKTCPGFKE